MMRRAITIAILYLPLVGHSQNAKGDESSEAMHLCAVIANSSAYDGKAIVVSGLYRFVIHGAVLMDRSCPEAEVNLRNAPGYKANKQAWAVMRSLTKKDQFQPIDVVLRGTLHVAREGQCLGEICARYEIEITELVSARPAPPENARTTSAEGLNHEPGHAQGTSAP
jgi:hypothetical protein